MILPVSAWWSGRKHVRNISITPTKAIPCRRGPMIIRETEFWKTRATFLGTNCDTNESPETLKGAQAIAAGGAALAVVPTLEMQARGKEAAAVSIDYYHKLGVRPFINAAGTYTVLAASTMPDEVQAAVALAAKRPVNLTELLDASGVYLAQRLHCEAALVTSGAAAALVVGTAACVTLGNDRAILGIPTDTADLKNEVIVQKSHRYGYDHALRNCGIRFVEVETLEDYEQAFNEHTVMAHFFNAGAGKISREDWLRVAH